jgi:hypothetical protein
MKTNKFALLIILIFGLVSTSNVKASSIDTTVKYLVKDNVIQGNLQTELDNYGKLGWSLVSCTRTTNRDYECVVPLVHQNSTVNGDATISQGGATVSGTYPTPVISYILVFKKNPVIADNSTEPEPPGMPNNKFLLIAIIVLLTVIVLILAFKRQKTG